MNILIIRNYPSYMSIKNNTYNIQEVGLAKALIRRGHQCDIVFWTDKKEEKVDIPVLGTEKKITVYYKKGRTVLKNTVFSGCKSLFDKYDILQPCEYNQVQAWKLAKAYAKKTVIYHGPYYSPFNKRYNAMCKFFDLFFLSRYKKLHTPFIVKSELAKDFLQKKGLQNIEVAGVGIDSEMLGVNGPNCEEPLYKVMSNDTSKKFLYIGRLEERRNIPFILDTFSKIKEKYTNSKLYIIGTGHSAYVDGIWKYAKELGVFDSIVSQERMEQKFLSQIYKMSDFFLLPTEYEIFGMVLLEAMYFRNIVITTSNGGSSTLINSGTNGIVDDSRNPGEWAERILELIENNQTMEKMRIEASETVKNRYTWDCLAETFEENYKRLLSGGVDR